MIGSNDTVGERSEVGKQLEAKLERYVVNFTLVSGPPPYYSLEVVMHTHTHTHKHTHTHTHTHTRALIHRSGRLSDPPFLLREVLVWRNLRDHLDTTVRGVIIFSVSCSHTHTYFSKT